VINEFETALTTLLTGDATLAALLTGGWFADIASEGVAAPYGIFSLHSGPTFETFGASGLTLWEPVYLVKAVDGPTQSKKRAGQAADRIFTLLNGQTLTVSGYGSGPALHVEAVSYDEPAGGSFRMKHVGGLYRFFVTK